MASAERAAWRRNVLGGRRGKLRAGRRSSRGRSHATAGSGEDEGGEAGDVQVEMVGVLQSLDGAHGQVLLVRKGSELRSGSSQLAEAPSEERILPIAVGGDAFYSIRALLEGWSPQRPLALHLLAHLVEAFSPSNASSSKPFESSSTAENDLAFQRVRIHTLSRSTFLGEITVSLASSADQNNSREVTLDCRPSDGMFLARRLGKPIFVSGSVWENASRPAADILPTDSSKSSSESSSGGSASNAASRMRSSMFKEAAATEDADPRYEIVSGDPDRIKWLKRQLSVALNEEDYEKAAELRDNHFFAKYLEAIKAGEDGQSGEKRKLLNELNREIEEEDARRSSTDAVSSTNAEEAAPAEQRQDQPSASSASSEQEESDAKGESGGEGRADESEGGGASQGGSS